MKSFYSDPHKEKEMKNIFSEIAYLPKINFENI